jgi:FkbH-like protein
MKLLEALEILKQPISEQGPRRELFLECGFTPLHLRTFLEAHLRRRFPASRTEIRTGLYGDLYGNLQRLQPSDGSVVCVIVEWADLDPRLGIRSLGSWRAADVPDIVESARLQSGRLTRLVERLAENVPVFVTTPTLPLPPIFASPGSRAQCEECELRAIAASLAASLSVCRRTHVMAAQRVDEMSPFGRRFDAKAEISTGFPYSLGHASRLAELFATLIRNVSPKKGLITDLDDTLWAGILGEVGVEGIAWDTSREGHLHGLFQRFLESLATAGVLLAAASKNDSALVEKALARSDMLLPRDRLYPLEINWGPKSASVRRVLEEWNIAAGDVVFIDDSPMELDEVHAAFPQMECILFPKGDCHAIWTLLRRLRDLFGKAVLTVEDDIRLQSIRTASSVRHATQGVDADNFLRHAEAKITFSMAAKADDHRAFELINKTNQFNLNGSRYTEAEWLKFFGDSDAFLLTADYEDKYGLLGKIVALLGRIAGSKLFVNSWVMSCRAFSRRIEHQCVKYLFDKTGVDEIVFDYAPTDRNGPIEGFFTGLLGTPPSHGLSVHRYLVSPNVPPLFHCISEVTNSAKTPTVSSVLSVPIASDGTG